ncbi:MAG: aldehyde dehydrogenase family protein, partial [Acidimicrobiales bacterium]
ETVPIEAVLEPLTLGAWGQAGPVCIKIQRVYVHASSFERFLEAFVARAKTVRCGDPLDEVVLRSYCVGAAHMALGWVCSEGLAVDEAGEVHDLTVRSFGVLRAVDTPPIDVSVEPSDDPPVNGSDTVFAAVAAAAWLAQDCPPYWPTGHRLRR